jgi:hypothetical protein
MCAPHGLSAVSLEVPRRAVPIDDAEQIASRERCSVRQVNMSISLAFLAPKLVRAAVGDRLPRGRKIEWLRHAPAEMECLNCSPKNWAGPPGSSWRPRRSWRRDGDHPDRIPGWRGPWRRQNASRICMHGARHAAWLSRQGWRQDRQHHRANYRGDRRESPAGHGAGIPVTVSTPDELFVRFQSCK